MRHSSFNGKRRSVYGANDRLNFAQSQGRVLFPPSTTFLTGDSVLLTRCAGPVSRSALLTLVYTLFSLRSLLLVLCFVHVVTAVAMGCRTLLTRGARAARPGTATCDVGRGHVLPREAEGGLCDSDHRAEVCRAYHHLVAARVLQLVLRHDRHHQPGDQGAAVSGAAAHADLRAVCAHAQEPGDVHPLAARASAVEGLEQPQDLQGAVPQQQPHVRC